jgi:hypothetical protein
LANVFPEDCLDEDDVLRNVEEEYLDEETEKISEISNDSEDDSSEEDVSSLFNSIIEEESEISQTRDECIEEYDNLPEYFTNINSWPKSINSLCWSCALKIYSIPWFIPVGKMKKSVPAYCEDIDFQEIDNNSNIFDNVSDFQEFPEVYQPPSRTKEIHVLIPYGRFCTPYCAQRYINRIKDPKIKNIWEASELLKHLYEKISGKPVQYIPEADDPTIMMQFCGPKGITAKEYRERNEHCRVVFSDKM